ncbi:hypothetical protein GCM10007315_01360 [Gemmobacter tilapiae]|uniref:Uncharacterized protein n=1 Tax=Neogemmobacter tilapiae TaxID=875041 RepID=A0A918WHA4_9RHOB|nr:hypothetical protein GCM10007315_01360 [Gemmobacter tilapiae]
MVGGKGVARQPADDKDHGHLRTKDGLCQNQNGEIAFGEAIVGGGDGIGHGKGLDLKI